MIEDAIGPRRIALHFEFSVRARLSLERWSELNLTFLEESRYVTNFLFDEQLIVEFENFIEILSHRLHDRRS